MRIPGGCMIGIRFTGKVSAGVFTKSLNNFYDLINDVERAVSKQSRGSLGWDLDRLSKNSTAIVECAPVLRSKAKDYAERVQFSILDALDRLWERPEHPAIYSYSGV